MAVFHLVTEQPDVELENSGLFATDLDTPAKTELGSAGKTILKPNQAKNRQCCALFSTWRCRFETTPRLYRAASPLNFASWRSIYFSANTVPLSPSHHTNHTNRADTSPSKSPPLHAHLATLVTTYRSSMCCWKLGRLLSFRARRRIFFSSMVSLRCPIFFNFAAGNNRTQHDHMGGTY